MGQLVSWIRLHFTQCTEKRREAMDSDHPHQHPAYWEAVSEGNQRVWLMWPDSVSGKENWQSPLALGFSNATSHF